MAEPCSPPTAMDASRGECLWRDRRHAGALLGRRLAPHVHHHQDTTVVGIPRGGLEVAAELASVLQLPLSCWSVQRLTLPGQEADALGAIAPGNIHILDEARIRQLGLDAEGQRQWLRRHEERMRQEQLRFGDPAPGELSHRRLILVDEGIRSGMTMAAALRSLRALYPATITVAVPVGRRLALDALRELADHVLALQAVEQLPRLADWFAALPALEEREVVALLGAA